MLLSMLKLVMVLLVLSPSIRATAPVLSMAQLASSSSVMMVLLGSALPSLARISLLTLLITRKERKKEKVRKRTKIRKKR